MSKRWKWLLCFVVIGFNQGCTPVGHISASVTPPSVDMIESVAIPGYDLKLISMEDVVVPGSLVKSRIGNPDSYVEFGERYKVLQSSNGFREKGLASWYGIDFHGRDTSSGEVYDMYEMTAAHKTLPLPTYVRVSNLDNGRSSIDIVNDRGPFIEGRIIELSYAAAYRLGITGPGTANVEIIALEPAAVDPQR